MTRFGQHALQYSKIVADTGEFELIKEFKPTDSTTNPSLVYKAVQARECPQHVCSHVDPARADGAHRRTVMQKLYASCSSPVWLSAKYVARSTVMGFASFQTMRQTRALSVATL